MLNTPGTTAAPDERDSRALIWQAGSRLIAAVDNWLAPAFDLTILCMSSMFFSLRLAKNQQLVGTLQLFANDYHVPLLPPYLAAVMGAGDELGLSVLLALGLAGRFGAAGLFVLNLVAATSYPDISDLGIQGHWLWGALLLVIALHGAGRIALDEFIRHACQRRFMRQN